MTKEELLLMALCREVLVRGIQTDRFTELWLASGVRLDGSELDIAHHVIQCSQKIGPEGAPSFSPTLH